MYLGPILVVHILHLGELQPAVKDWQLVRAYHVNITVDIHKF